MDHTPGPWEVDDTGCIRTTVRQHKYAPSIPLASAWIEGAWCDSDATPESMANAYLCAAGPELLQALILLRERCEYQHLREVADAAIAKASPPSTKE